MDTLLFIAGLIAIIASVKIWRSWFRIGAEKTDLWAKDVEASLQDDYLDLEKRILEIRKRNGDRWIKPEDIAKLME